MVNPSVDSQREIINATIQRPFKLARRTDPAFTAETRADRAEILGITSPGCAARPLEAIIPRQFPDHRLFSALNRGLRWASS